MMDTILKFGLLLLLSVETFASEPFQSTITVTVDSEMVSIEKQLKDDLRNLKLWNQLREYRSNDEHVEITEEKALTLYNILHELRFWKQIDPENTLFEPSDDQKIGDARCARKWYIENLSRELAKLWFESFKFNLDAINLPGASRIVLASRLLNCICGGGVMSEFYKMWREVSAADFEKLEKVVTAGIAE